MSHAIIAAMTIDARAGFLGSHILVSISALGIGLSISVPAAIAPRRRPVLRATLLAAAYENGRVKRFETEREGLGISRLR